jgi:hypothetical protein
MRILVSIRPELAEDQTAYRKLSSHLAPSGCGRTSDRVKTSQVFPWCSSREDQLHAFDAVGRIEQYAC